ncbi:MAG: YciI family protein [Alphaproteobacteria bacterium]|nr:YciI family protein [Alphaproteobacteria bacterium]
MLYLIVQGDRPDAAAEIRQAKTDAHLTYLDQHEDILVLGGALLTDDSGKRVGSVALINVPNRAAADAFVANEPFRQAGLYQSILISRMRKGQWNPAVAPKTPEGD